MRRWDTAVLTLLPAEGAAERYREDTSQPGKAEEEAEKVDL